MSKNEKEGVSRRELLGAGATAMTVAGASGLVAGGAVVVGFYGADGNGFQLAAFDPDSIFVWRRRSGRLPECVDCGVALVSGGRDGRRAILYLGCRAAGRRAGARGGHGHCTGVRLADFVLGTGRNRGCVGAGVALVVPRFAA